MGACSSDRNTPRRTGTLFVDPVAAAVRIFAGSLVVLDAQGNAKPAVGATGLVARGRAQAQVDNRLGLAGDLTVAVEAGVFGFNHDGDVTRAHIGSLVYLVDDQTVSATATGQSAAGILMDLEPDGETAFVAVGLGERQASGFAPSHRVFAAGIHAWAGGAAATDSIAVAGLEPTDIVQATLVARAAAETLVLAANDAGNDQIDLTLSANGTNGTTKVAYSVLRAVL